LHARSGESRGQTEDFRFGELADVDKKVARPRDDFRAFLGEIVASLTQAGIPAELIK
jgi:hypothetical protein